MVIETSPFRFTYCSGAKKSRNCVSSGGNCVMDENVNNSLLCDVIPVSAVSSSNILTITLLSSMEALNSRWFRFFVKITRIFERLVALGALVGAGFGGVTVGGRCGWTGLPFGPTTIHSGWFVGCDAIAGSLRVRLILSG